jgi:hypothetical protein
VRCEIGQVALLPQHGAAAENGALLQMREAAQPLETPVFMDFSAISGGPHKNSFLRNAAIIAELDFNTVI